MENKKESLVPVETKQYLGTTIPKNEVSVFNTNLMDSVWKFAQKISIASLIPDHYQNNPSNCFLALWKSERMGMDFHSFMQVSYIVRGKFGYEAKFVIARLNNSGKFKGPIRWKADGKIVYEKRTVSIKLKSGERVKKEKIFVTMESTRSWTAYATLKDCGETVEQEFKLTTAIMNGWSDDHTSKWNTMTEEMGQYRSAVFLGRMYAPEIIMDMQTREEFEDIETAETIDLREMEREIFDEGKEFSTEPDQVIDPAKEVKQEAASQAVQPPETTAPVSDPVPPANAQEKQPAIPENASPVSAADIDKLALQDKNPPDDVAEFKEWFFKRFANESQDLDVFLLSKKWLTMGQTAADLTESKLKNLRSQWSRFTTAYETFKKTRKAGQA